MNFEYYIARTLINSKRSASKDNSNAPDSDKGGGTGPIIRVAIMSIVLGLTVMILAVSIVTGFQREIRSKVIGFGSHVTIGSLELTPSLEPKPLSKSQSFYPYLDTVQGVRHIQVYAVKAGIIKTEDEVHGIMLKGAGKDFDWSFFSKNIVEGAPFNMPDSSAANGVIISRYLANLLKLGVGDDFRMYFIQEPVRQRRFEVTGIYNTGLEQLDKVYMLCDIRHIQKLNGWEENHVSGFEVLLDDYDMLSKADKIIPEHIGYDMMIGKITDNYKEIFGWLELLDINVIVILLFCVLVAGINMVSALLILILERTAMIGIFKALGSTNASIQKIFLYHATYLIVVGIFWGNVLGIGLCLLQKYFGIITLPPETYYIDVVPINLSLFSVLLLNIATFLLCLLMLVLPTFIVARITPVKAIRFD